MSAIIPSPQAPVVDPKTGLVTREWNEFFRVLTKLPSARLSASATYDPPNIGAGGTTTTTVTVPGATLGWSAAASFSLDLTGLTLTAYVSAANTVTVGLHNPTGGAINLGSGTLTAFAWKP